MSEENFPTFDDSNVTLTEPQNGKHWYYKVQKFFLSMKSFSESDANQSRNSIFERR